MKKKNYNKMYINIYLNVDEKHLKNFQTNKLFLNKIINGAKDNQREYVLM